MLLPQLWPKRPGYTKRHSGVMFSVDDVTPATDSISTERLIDNLSRRFARKVFLLPEPDRPVTNRLIDLQRKLIAARPGAFRLPVSRCHPLIDAIHIAFSQHRALMLSPDDIWLVIAQGFGHHVAANAEKLRHRLVRHPGRRELVADLNDLTLPEFESTIEGLSTQIREATDPVLHETLICDFSTTTRAIRTASEVALLDAFSSYFDYSMNCICGIPKITLEGSLEDWQRIRARVEVIETYDLAWWVSRLRPIPDEFVLTASGRPTREFWKAIYKPEKAYGGHMATGWITDLFPYLGEAPQRRRNLVFEHERHEWASPLPTASKPEAWA